MEESKYIFQHILILEKSISYIKTWQKKTCVVYRIDAMNVPICQE